MDRCFIGKTAFYVVLCIIPLALGGCGDPYENIRVIPSANMPAFSTTCAAGICYTRDSKGTVVNRTEVLPPLKLKTRKGKH